MKLSLLPALLSLHKQTAAQLFTIMLSHSAPVARLVRSKRVNHHHNYLPSIKLEVVGFPLCAARILSARTPGGGRRNVSISLYYGPSGRGQAGKLYSPPAQSVM